MTGVLQTGKISRRTGNTWRRLGHSPAVMLGLVIVGAFLTLALVAPWLASSDPAQTDTYNRFQPPSLAHPFGTDNLGRDLYSRVIWGSQLALELGGISVAVGATGGVAIGLVAGYYGGVLDQVLSALIDLLLALPGLLVALVVVAILGASFESVIVALAVFGWPGYARLVRGSVLTLKQRGYVQAAYAIGVTEWRIITRHILPNLVGPVIILAATHFGGALLIGSSLSFVGLGARIPQPEWGAMIAAGTGYLEQAWWIAVFPGLLIGTVVFGVNLLGDGLQDVLAGPGLETGRL